MALVHVELNDSIDFWRQRYNELVDYITPGSGNSLFKSDFPSPGSAPIADAEGKFSSNWIRFGGELMSNLNADLLDGQHGAFYQNAGNLNAGSIPAARIGNDTVTNAMSANMVQATVKGRAAGAGTGDPTDLTAAQLIDVIETADGAGSGLDADTVDGLNTAVANTVNTVVIRDAAGRFQATDPSAAQDVATKNFVTSFGTGGYRKPVFWVADAPIVSSSDYTGNTLINRPALISGPDGGLVGLPVGTRILYPWSESGTESAGAGGVYEVTTQGSGSDGVWTRAADMPVGSLLQTGERVVVTLAWMSGQVWEFGGVANSSVGSTPYEWLMCEGAGWKGGSASSALAPRAYFPHKIGSYQRVFSRFKVVLEGLNISTNNSATGYNLAMFVNSDFTNAYRYCNQLLTSTGTSTIVSSGASPTNKILLGPSTFTMLNTPNVNPVRMNEWEIIMYRSLESGIKQSQNLNMQYTGTYYDTSNNLVQVRGAATWEGMGGGTGAISLYILPTNSGGNPLFNTARYSTYQYF